VETCSSLKGVIGESRERGKIGMKGEGGVKRGFKKDIKKGRLIWLGEHVTPNGAGKVQKQGYHNPTTCEIKSNDLGYPYKKKDQGEKA